MVSGGRCPALSIRWPSTPTPWTVRVTLRPEGRRVDLQERDVGGARYRVGTAPFALLRPVRPSGLSGDGRPRR